jgi:hypothetical protein
MSAMRAESVRSAAVFLALFALVFGNAVAGERLFTGRLESVLLRPHGTGTCPDNISKGTATADGMTSVSVSNSCGCQEITITVDEPLLGSSERGPMTIKTSLGEWCRPTLPIGRETVLVHVNETNGVSWSPLEAAGQDKLFETKRFGGKADVLVGSLPEVKTGFASLAALRKKLAAGR